MEIEQNETLKKKKDTNDLEKDEIIKELKLRREKSK